MTRPVRYAALACAMAFATAGGATGEAAGPACPATPEAAKAPIEDVNAPPADVLLACVGAEPIDGALFSHWLGAAQKGSAEGAPMRDVRDSVLEFLTGALWVTQEASAQHVRVSDIAVTRRFNQQKHASFKTNAEFRSFLRDSGMTVTDVRYRVRLDMLSEAMRKKVTGKGTDAQKLRRLDRFVSHFRSKWIARTWCRTEYAIDACGAPPVA